ncbi:MULTISPECIES: LacI family DNA-binding transcriptional regulator [unclassified Streptomyces]|uniref:LacI family DNA-binding transcriptional regulator n=1 Tax=unclassified Streptomyces TaxID=2593676 RepID=UPI00278BCC6F|nr:MULTISPECIES: LacI family DNA-binding transcriptional regulator [unclassified Streptomyces]
MGDPTLHDVAARAGVSIKTVSNVLRGVRGKVSTATAERVHQAIAELGYRPNLSARRLRTGKSGVLSLAVPDLRNPYFSEVATAMIRAARAVGHTLLIEETGGDPEVELHAAEGLGDPMISGVVLAPLTVDPERLAGRARPVPLVLLGEHDGDGDCDHVTFDNLTASREMTGHLIARGYRRIAVVGRQEGPVQAAAVAERRLAGHREALAAAGLPQDPRLAPALPASPAGYGKSAGMESAGALLDGGPPPDALYCFADVLAVGALRAAHERGLRVPDDLGLAGFDGIEEGRFTIPTLTTVVPDFADMATRAITALIERIDTDGPVGHRDIVCRHELAARESTLPKRA